MLKAARGLAIATFLALVLAAPVAAGEPTTIGITGGWPVSVTLEIGQLSITLNAHEGGGVTSVELDGPTVVRVRRLSDCVPLVRFVAQPGRTYFIDWDSNGHPRVEDHTNDGLDSGPGMELHYRRACPALPDSSTGPVPPGRDGSPILLLAAVAAAAFVLTLQATSPRVRTRGRGTWPGRP
jgi:hypothetical protein